jgi:hypothetical protein
VAEAGDTPAGEDSVRRCFASDQYKNLTDWSIVNRQSFRMHAYCKQVLGVRRRGDRESRDFPLATIPDEKYLTAGIDEDGTPGEIFITAAK